jgi:hypothetical protein
MSRVNCLLLFLMMLNITGVYATKDEFAVSLLPDSMLKKANSVVRVSEISLVVSSAEQARYHVHKVVTVLNHAGAEELEIYFHYDPFTKLNSFKASVFDKDGKLMNKRSESDLRDYASHDGFSLFIDSRFKHLQIGGGVYPVTVEYTYVLDFKGMLDYPDWEIQEANQSVEVSTYQVEMPAQIGLSHKPVNTDLMPTVMTPKGAATTIYTWRTSGVKAISVPVNSYTDRYFLPMVDVTPEVFEIAGYKGSWANWKTFGEAMNRMWKDTRNLSSEAVNEARRIVSGLNTEREKAAALYLYLQNNFRYVSVQIGVGGYIPFTAATVHATRYGDCKALSNYMCALLKSVGIKSFPVLINAGDKDHSIDTSFVSDKFNHAILYVELADGPVWLECTSNTIPFGELGIFTENRYALVLTDEGGKIMRTPSANANLNTVKISSQVTVDSNFSAFVLSNVQLGGEYRQQAKPYFLLGNEKKRSHYAFNSLGLKQTESYTFENIIDSASEIFFQQTGRQDKVYDFKTGGKAFLPTSYVKNWYENVSIDTSYQSDLVTDFPSVKNEQLTYKFTGTICRSLPADFELDNKLVQFKRKCERLPDNKISILTSFSIKQNIIASVDIGLLKESLQRVSKYLQQKVIVD